MIQLNEQICMNITMWRRVKRVIGWGVWPAFESDKSSGQTECKVNGSPVEDRVT